MAATRSRDMAAAQQTGLHRRIRDHADVIRSDVRQNFRLNLRRNDTVRRLQRSDGSDRLDARHLLRVVIANANPANFAGLLECGARFPAFLDIFIRLRPVDLVEINRIDAESAQAFLALAQNRFALQAFVDDAVGAPAAFAFRENIGPIRAAFDSAADDFFGVSRP